LAAMRAFGFSLATVAQAKFITVPGGGLIDEKCVIQVPNGQVFDAKLHEPSAGCSLVPPNVQIYASDVHLHSTEPLTSFTADWVVPPLPRQDIGQTVYFWPGFKARQPEMGLPVLQPVLQYGQRGGEWELQSWFVDAYEPSYPVVTAPAISVSPGHKITSYMSLSADSQTWTVYGENRNTGETSNLKISYSRSGNTDYDYAMLVNENINVDTQCSAMPDDSNQPGVITFTNVTVNGRVPTWTTRANCKGNPQCDCDNSAVVDGDSVKLGWSTQASSKVSEFPTFDQWQILHGKNYGSTDKVKRSQIYEANLAAIALKNAQDTARYWPDEYADLTIPEWKAVRGITGFPQDGSPHQCNFENPSVSSHNSSNDGDIDWRTKGAVTAVKSQGQYGTCGYFSSIAVMEGINVIQGGNELVALSEQELLDCCTDICQGWPGEELEYYHLKSVKAKTEASYPYEGPSSQCRASSAAGTPATSAGRLCVPNDDPKVLKAHLNEYGPAVWMIDSSSLASYSGGIISSSSARGSPGSWPHYSGIDHATTVVGSGTENGVAFWIVKNSWGSSWGENGYYRVKMDEAGDHLTKNPYLNAPGAIFGLFPKSNQILV